MPAVRTEIQPISADAQAADKDRERHQEPPRPAEAHGRRSVDAEDGDHIAGDAGDRDLRQADHAAIAGEQHQRQRDHAEDQRIGADLDR